MKTVARALVEALEILGVRIVFGLPGVHNLALWEALRQSEIELIGVRHEQTTVYAADGHARLTGELGVAMATTGPGAANTVAACGEAWASGSPVMVIATDIPSTLRRPGVYRGALHETRDQASMFETIVKKAYLVGDPESAVETLYRAAREALEGPTGPVYLEIPTDYLRAESGESAAPLPPLHPPSAPQGEVDRAARALAEAERPLIWVGRGALAARVEVVQVADALGAPVIETYGARGVLPLAYPGRVGYAPHFPEVGQIWDRADAVLAVGTDFDGMMTQNWGMPSPAFLASVNLLAEDAHKNYRPDVFINGDSAETLRRLVAALPRTRGSDGAAQRVAAVRENLERRLTSDEPAAMALLGDLQASVPETVPVSVDMCVAGYWVGAVRGFAQPRLLAYPMGWGTLGFGFPASIGMALSQRRPTLCVCGDGGFLFAAGELAVLAERQPPLTVLIVDDGGYGMLRYDQIRAGEPAFGVDLAGPDFVALAKSFGIEAEMVASAGEPLRRALRHSLQSSRPRVLVLRAALSPPETTSPRWYRSRQIRPGG